MLCSGVRGAPNADDPPVCVLAGHSACDHARTLAAFRHVRSASETRLRSCTSSLG